MKHPLPRIEELFAALSRGHRFSKLDLTAAYNQLEVTVETGRRLAWSTQKGIYALKKLPFGTKPACANFSQSNGENIVRGCRSYLFFRRYCRLRKDRTRTFG